MGRKKTRWHSRWRADSDYKKKLPKAARAWLEKFESEYYRAEFKEEPLHGLSARREIFAAQNAAARDVVTAPPDELARAAERRTVAPNHRDRHYQPGDYAMFGGGGEIDQVERIDARARAERLSELAEIAQENARACGRLQTAA